MSWDTFGSMVQAVTKARSSESRKSAPLKQWAATVTTDGVQQHSRKKKSGMPVWDYAHIITYLWARRDVFKLSLVSCGFFLVHFVSLSLIFLAPLPSLFAGWAHKSSRAGSCLLVCWGFFCKVLKKMLKAVRLCLHVESVQQSLNWKRWKKEKLNNYKSI